MSERWVMCSLCRGTGLLEFTLGNGLEVQACPRCEGTGMSGDANDYMKREYEKDRINEEG